jgi:hypothetical protein
MYLFRALLAPRPVNGFINEIRSESIMKKRTTLLLSVIALIVASTEVAQAQPAGKYVKKILKQYWTDERQRPWNDLSYRVAIRIDPQFASSLQESEISSEDNPPLKYGVGDDWHLFNLKTDANGTYAEPEVLVYADSSDPIIYQVELRDAGGKSPSFVPGGSSKVEARNDTAGLPTVKLNKSNSIFMKDWMIVAGVMLAGAILIYILVFRWLFRGLLFTRRWGVSKAEHFTWSMSLLGMLALAAGLTVLYLGPRLETWVIIGVMGAFWLLHAIVWLASGSEA